MVLFIIISPRITRDVTGLATYDEVTLSKELNLSFEKSDTYTARVRILSRAVVLAKASEGFAVVYIDKEQQGVFFDSDKYSLYGLRIGDQDSII